MPRTLPWLVGANKNKAERHLSPTRTPRRHLSPSSARPRKRDPSPDDLVNSDLDDIGGTAIPKRHGKRRMTRSPSTSPPPAPPDVQYMDDGYEGDDGWMMVEDEFYSTATTFTQHIHHAEYVRLKRLARARGEQTLSRLERGTDGMTEVGKALRLQRANQEKARKQKAALKSMAGSDAELSLSDDSDEPILNPQLAGLMMTGSQKMAPDLSKYVRPPGGPRSAPAQGSKEDEVPRDVHLGHTRPSQVVAISDDSDDDTDDLGAMPDPPVIRDPPSTALASSRATGCSDYAQRTSNGTGFFQRFAKAAAENTIPPKLTEPTGKHHARALEATAYDGGQSAPSVSPPSIGRNTFNEVDSQVKGGTGTRALERLRQRQAERERRKEEHSKREVTSEPMDDIPTFLF